MQEHHSGALKLIARKDGGGGAVGGRGGGARGSIDCTDGKCPNKVVHIEALHQKPICI